MSYRRHIGPHHLNVHGDGVRRIHNAERTICAGLRMRAIATAESRQSTAMNKHSRAMVPPHLTTTTFTIPQHEYWLSNVRTLFIKKKRIARWTVYNRLNGLVCIHKKRRLVFKTCPNFCSQVYSTQNTKPRAISQRWEVRTPYSYSHSQPNPSVNRAHARHSYLVVVRELCCRLITHTLTYIRGCVLACMHIIRAHANTRKHTLYMCARMCAQRVCAYPTDRI